MKVRWLTGFVPLVIVFACGSGKSTFGNGGDDGGGYDGPTFGDTGTSDALAIVTSCAAAAAAKSYVGCDYWPTVTGNTVWSIFDFAAVVANASGQPANITITGPNGTNQTGTVAPGEAQKFYLPWVKSLKGVDWDSRTNAAGTAFTASVIAHGGAYHLVSDVPVSVYQFNAIEYKPSGGPAGKDWSACPNNKLFGVNCFSYSNDASLLLPSTAMTGNYRVMGQKGWTEGATSLLGPYFVITATQDNTSVTVKTSATSQVLAGQNVPATNGAGTFTLSLNAGDVAEIAGETGDQNDFSGSIVQANNPVQVITGVQCINQPEGTPACDHVEGTVFPAETLGEHYVVTVPTGPKGNVVGHVVRFFGNVDGTTLTYAPSAPAGCPTTLNAGQVVECSGIVKTDFEVQGTGAFGVGTYMLGGTLLDPGTGEGDPSQSFAVAVEQYRSSYIFLAPNDYDVSYVDIVGPPGVSVTIDGTSVNGFQSISNAFGIARYKLGAGNAGSHSLTSSAPVGIQVMGYGLYTSYQYPGGSDLVAIAPPPVK